MKEPKVREIVLDTETTGLAPEDGHRLVEIGAVELLNHLPTGKVYHQYINPERDMPAEAFNIHGLSEKFLSDKPVFLDIASDFLDFIGDTQLIIHNAEFDIKFLNFELSNAGAPIINKDRVTDSLAMARKKFPGMQNSLDGLCRRFSIDNSRREKHGALLDSEILAEVYLELIGGRQTDLSLQMNTTSETNNIEAASIGKAQPRERPLPSRLTPEEQQAHLEFISAMSDDPLWKRRQ